jgi:hypothetical protein
MAMGINHTVQAAMGEAVRSLSDMRAPQGLVMEGRGIESSFWIGSDT